MFGVQEAMLAYLRRQIGLRTDAANAAGSIHAKLGVLGIPNPVTVDELTIMNYLYKLKQMSGIAVPSATLRKSLTGSGTAVPTDQYEGRYRAGGTATICSFMTSLSGKIRVYATGQNAEYYGSGNQGNWVNGGLTVGQYPYMYATIGGSSVGSAVLSGARDYTARTVYMDIPVQAGKVVTIAISTGYLYYVSCGSTYYYYNGGSISGVSVRFDYDYSGVVQI